MFHKLKVSQRTGARPSQDINVARVLGQVFPPTSHGFGKGRLSLQNLDLAHAWRQRPWLVLSLHGSQPQGTGARTWGQTQPRYVVSGPWALQPSRGEQHRCLCGTAMSPPQEARSRLPVELYHPKTSSCQGNLISLSPPEQINNLPLCLPVLCTTLLVAVTCDMMWATSHPAGRRPYLAVKQEGCVYFSS